MIIRLFAAVTLVAVLAVTAGCCCPCGAIPNTNGQIAVPNVQEIPAPGVTAASAMQR